MPTDIKILDGAKTYLRNLPESTIPSVTDLMGDALRSAAGMNGNQVLDAFEAQELSTHYARLTFGNNGLTPASAHRLSTAMKHRAAELSAARPQGTSVIFTSEGQALTRFREAITGAIQDTIDKADGRRVDINMMLFAFTDQDLANSLLEIARTNPNAHLRLMTDWSQLSTSGSRQPPRLAAIAAREGLTNLEVKFKKDNPYVWDHDRKRPRFHHGATEGLNHHKGFITLIDGVPERMAFGSFNWSVGAMKRNYENMVLLDRLDPDNRPTMLKYDDEFAAFWNDKDLALTFGQARTEKNRLYKNLYEEHGATFNPIVVPANEHLGHSYQRPTTATRIDINSFGEHDVQELSTLVGDTRASAVLGELRAFGRFNSWDELLARVPELAYTNDQSLEILKDALDYGNGEISINTASAKELIRAGFTSRLAHSIVSFRDAYGSFESIDETDAIRGVGPVTLEKLKHMTTDDEVWGSFSARRPGEHPTTGFAPSNRTTVRIPSTGASWPGDLDADGIPDNRSALEETSNTLDAQVADMLRRAEPGQTFRLAMYGMSTRAPEYRELVQAAERGVRIRVVLYGKHTGKAITALQELRRSGLDVDLRVIKNRVMHEKFGVVGDDVFNGSSNWSTSSISKHAEDRFTFRNMPEIAQQFIDEFNRLWDRANPPR